MSGSPDLIVVGSGPSSAQAAKAAVERGLTVLMVDVGHEDTAFGASVPDRPFSELRATDADQHRYFVGLSDPTDRHGEKRVGSQLTPPRQFIKRDVERHLPIDSHTFFPLQSLALGGLGAGWGAGTLTFEDFELREAGLSWDELAPYYREVAADIGISGAPGDDTGAMVLNLPGMQPPLDLDTNAAALLGAYERRRHRLHQVGFFLGRSPSAILTRPIERGPLTRYPNAYRDMDFYSDHQRSVYRPRFTVEELAGHPAFSYLGGHLVESFEETEAGVRVYATAIGSGRGITLEGRALALGAGAINSARIVLRSTRAYHRRIPLLCNPYHYVAAVNLPMLGRPAADRRHSLSQLTGVLTDPTRREADRSIVSIFSYRSLLLFRLVREMPLPPALGLQVARILQTSFTILGVHHPDRPSASKWLELRSTGHGTDRLAAEYESSAAERAACRATLSQVGRALRALWCLPVSELWPAPGSSIHFAGTLPIDEDPRVPLRCGRDGRLNQTRRVYLVDSAPWRFLPAKGPTFTQMANARRVIAGVAAALRESRSLVQH